MANLGASREAEANPAGGRSGDPRDIIDAAVAAAFIVPLGELRASTRRQAPVALARQSAMYLAHVAFGLKLQRGRPCVRARPHDCRLCVPADRGPPRRPGLDTALAELEHALRRNFDATFGAVS